MRHYRKEEDYWTEAVVKFLANSGGAALRQLLGLARLPWKVTRSDGVEYTCQERGDESIPDAVVLDRRSDFVVAIEAKVGAGFNLKQARAHINYIKKRYPTMRHALVLLTNDTTKHSGSRVVELTASAGGCRAVHVNWHDIGQLANRVHSSSRNANTRFLAKHFASFVREEVEPMTPWIGFAKSFRHDWQRYEEFSEQMRALLEMAGDEAAGVIRRLCPRLVPRTSGITQGENRDTSLISNRSQGRTPRFRPPI